jgi:prepilin-type N-terminal cleavage/methylation domain-containing protein
MMFKKGFSLLELAVSLVIISVLAAVILSGAGIKKTARISGAKSLTSSANLGGIADLIFWVETTNIENLTIESDGTVSAWRDISSITSGTVVEQSTASARPLYVEDVLNGLPALRFDGSNDFMFELSNNNLIFSDEVTVFAVYDTTNSANDDIIVTQVSCSPALDRHGYSLSTRTTPGGSRMYLYNAGGITTPDVTAAADDVYINIFKYDNGSVSFQQNNTNAISSNSMTAPPNGDLYIGAGQQSPCGTNFYGSVDIGEIIIFKRALDADEISGVVNYLSKKWNVDASYTGS